MTNRLSFGVRAVLPFGAVLLLATPALADWQTKVNYGGSTVMDLYVPTKVDASPGIVVSLHYCSGTSTNAHGWFQSLADMYGFIIIAPSAGGNCFDATPARSGERDAISKMVKYVVTQNHADATRVFAAGASSGACMTQALLAAYPDVFAGGSVLAGVPAGAWTGGNAYGWSSATKTAQAWGDIVRNADMGFTGARPRLQLWHAKSDDTLTYTPNFPSEVLQWTNVLGLTDANGTTSSYTGPQNTWARISYKDSAGRLALETNVMEGGKHDLSGFGLWPDVVRFFGLDKDAPTGGGTGGAGGTSSAGAGGTPSGSAGTSAAAGAGNAAATGGTGGASSAGGATTGTAGSSGAPVSSAGGSAGAPVSSAGGSAGASSTVAGAATSTPVASGSTPDDSGCGCRVSGTGSDAGARSRGALIGLLAAGLGVVLRRRKRSAP